MHRAALIGLQLVLACRLLAPGGVNAQAAEPTSRFSAGHDGRWQVVLACPGTMDKSGLVKGYEYSFLADIEKGVLRGQFGTVGKVGSVTWSGTVLEDGTLKISAAGHTGSPAFAAGKVASGTSYTYSLTGRLGPSTGQAFREQARPCTAALTRQLPP